jgi:2-polyprenyl-3-methyl-5-hydroxy-6-metoxy-1,4-benzoquinol methylase
MASMQASPQRIFETFGAFQRTAALRAAIELDIFTAIGEGANTPSALAKRCSASERGVRILSDYLVMLGFVEKRNDTYVSSSEAAAFLDRRSDAYVGAAAAEAFSGDAVANAYASLARAVRRGGTALAAGGTLEPEHPIWVDFARAMSPSGANLARLLADCLQADARRPTKVLDIAAGHGLFGVEFAKRDHRAETYAVDWPQVLVVARENAAAAGLVDRFHAIPGDALSVDLGADYDLALVTNFCPDLAATTAMLSRVHAALAPGGRVALLEAMLNDDRISPPAAASLNLTLLATTPSGETRTPTQLAESLRQAGFSRVDLRELPPAPQRVMVAWK